jgi:glycosyltransferase involved in cell wall biosynthesis
LIRAFAAFLKETGTDARLVMIKAGPHVDRARNLISHLGIDPKAVWLDPMQKENLINYYGAVDAVFDQFSGRQGLGLSLIGREAMSCGCPVVTWFDFDGNDNYYQDAPPLISATTEDEISAAMVRLAADPNERENIGRRAREWIYRTHHWEVAIDRYKALYREVLS